jgi:hypothetical protein
MPRISVLRDGAVLLDGKNVDLTQLADALQALPDGASVSYYREAAGGEPPPAALEVMKLIVERRLPVRLSTKPDFSDTVGPDAEALEQAFSAIRRRAAQRHLVILCPNGRVMSMPAMARDAAPADAVSAVERMLPSSKPRKVAVIADTSWTLEAQPNIQAAGRAIPFFGMLMGFASIGHAVWVFDGSAGAAGCQEADLVIVDSARVDRLPPGWEAATAVRVYDRETRELRKI